MKREILFRGLSIKDNKWVYGDLHQNFDRFKIREKKVDCIAKSYVVESGSVGQFTGLTDKNGTKIFEGDWIQSAPGYTSVVEFKDGAFISKYSHPEDGEELFLRDLNVERTEVIGNIHENN